MRFGVNYVPSQKWFHSWVDFDEAAIREDLTAIRSLGLDHIRAHLMWSYFQPDTGLVLPAALRNLEKFKNLCEEVGIDFFLSLFTGFMSGSYFFPAFIKRDNRFAMFSGEKEKAAEKYYIAKIASVVAESPRFLGFDLGNELSCVTWMEKESGMDVFDAWQSEMLAECGKVAPGKLHNNGVDHNPWFHEKAFSRRALANAAPILPLHCWTKFTGALNREGGLLGSSSVYLTRYMAELARSYCDDPAKPIWIQEIGCSPLWADRPEDTGVFLARTMDTIAAIPGLWGVTWWCSHDISHELCDFDPLEYDLGLMDIHNRPKKDALALKEWIAKYKTGGNTPAVSDCAIVYQPEDPAGNGWVNGARYISFAEKGIFPAIIQPGKENDPAYLAMRGIRRILD